jgi:hypothetical protein
MRDRPSAHLRAGHASPRRILLTIASSIAVLVAAPALRAAIITPSSINRTVTATATVTDLDSGLTDEYTESDSSLDPDQDLVIEANASAQLLNQVVSNTASSGIVSLSSGSEGDMYLTITLGAEGGWDHDPSQPLCGRCRVSAIATAELVMVFDVAVDLDVFGAAYDGNILDPGTLTASLVGPQGDVWEELGGGGLLPAGEYVFSALSSSHVQVDPDEGGIFQPNSIANVDFVLVFYPIPEPAGFALFALGLVGLAAAARLWGAS